MNDLELPWVAISWQNAFSTSTSWIRAFECRLVNEATESEAEAEATESEAEAEAEASHHEAEAEAEAKVEDTN